MKKKHFTIIAIIIICVFWLVASNSILLLVNGDTGAISFDENKYVYLDEVTFGIDKIIQVDGLMENILTSGWLFGEGEQKKGERFVSVVLKSISSGKCYELKEDNSYFEEEGLSYSLLRSDVKSAYSDRKLGKERIVGFSVLHSTINLNRDVYEVILHYKESDKEEGLKKTGLYIEKGNGKLSVLENPIIRCRDKVANQEELLKYNIENASYEDEELHIKGWAFADNRDCHFQRVFVEVKMPKKTITYFVPSIERNDVSDEFKDRKYNWSGFDAHIKDAEIQEAPVSVRVIIDNKGYVISTDTKLLDA